MQEDIWSIPSLHLNPVYKTNKRPQATAHTPPVPKSSPPPEAAPSAVWAASVRQEEMCIPEPLPPDWSQSCSLGPAKEAKASRRHPNNGPARIRREEPLLQGGSHQLFYTKYNLPLLGGPDIFLTGSTLGGAGRHRPTSCFCFLATHTAYRSSRTRD